MKKRKPNQPKTFLPVKIKWEFVLGVPVTEPEKASEIAKTWLQGISEASPLPIVNSGEVMIRIDPDDRVVALSEDDIAELVLQHQSKEGKKVKPQPKKRHHRQRRCLEDCSHAQGQHAARNANGKRPCMVNGCKCKNFQQEA